MGKQSFPDFSIVFAVDAANTPRILRFTVSNATWRKTLRINGSFAVLPKLIYDTGPSIVLDSKWQTQGVYLQFAPHQRCTKNMAAKPEYRLPVDRPQNISTETHRHATRTYVSRNVITCRTLPSVCVSLVRCVNLIATEY